jgi:hypothetical protein
MIANSLPANQPANHRWLFALCALLALSAIRAGAASYVGSAACNECHADKVAMLQQSIHSKMIRPNAHLPGVIHGDLRKPNAPTTNDVHWVMGGWYKEESYIRTNWTGSNWTYTVTQYQWDPIAGTYVNNQSLRDWTVKCAGCHTTGYDPATRTWNELNIGCEHCHGPGGDHVSAPDPGTVLPVIDRSSEGCGHCHIRAESVAMGSFTNKQFNFPIGYTNGDPSSLHYIPEPLTATASFFPDGTSKRHRQQYLDVNYPGAHVTKHYQQGVSCTSCHNPHTSGTVSTYTNGLPTNTYGIKIYDNVNNVTNYVAWDGANLWHPTAHTNISSRQICKSCHTTVQDHHVHQFNAAALAADVTCVDCHMPDVINVDPATLRGALRPHTFAAMPPANSLKYGANAQPNSCTYRCHQNSGADKTARAQWADSIISLKVAPLVASSHPFQVRVVGTPAYQYAVEASTDFTTWLPLTTNTAAALLNYTPRWGFEFSDPGSDSLAKRFYRVRQVYPAP